MASIFEEWSPITRDFGLIQCSVDQVARGNLEWAAEHRMMFTRRALKCSLAEKFEALLPLSNSKNRRLFIPTNCGWVAFFQNGIQGSDPAFNMMRLSLRLGVIAMRVCRAPPEARYQSVIWEVFATEELGGTRHGYRRSIAASDDGGRWIFEESGARYPFEQVEHYSAKRKRDRFTPEMLDLYLSHFGILKPGDNLLNSAIDKPAVLLERKNSSGLPEFTLEQAKQGLPWKR